MKTLVSCILLLLGYVYVWLIIDELCELVGKDRVRVITATLMLIVALIGLLML